MNLGLNGEVQKLQEIQNKHDCSENNCFMELWSYSNYLAGI